MDKKPEIILLGGGGHCRSCIAVIESEGRFEIAGIVDSFDGGDVANLFGYPVIGADEDLPELRKQFTFAFVTVGQIQSARVRRRKARGTRARRRLVRNRRSTRGSRAHDS